MSLKLDIDPQTKLRLKIIANALGFESDCDLAKHLLRGAAFEEWRKLYHNPENPRQKGKLTLKFNK